MHRNPVKRGLVLAPEQWPWSSFRHYAYDEAGPVLGVDFFCDRGETPIHPHTRLLRPHVLVDSDDAPTVGPEESSQLRRPDVLLDLGRARCCDSGVWI